MVNESMHRPRRAPQPSSLLPLDERPISDLASEQLEHVIAGLRLAVLLCERDEQILRHYLFGRSCAATAAHVGLRETTVHKHLHRLFSRTQTQSRRELLHHGLQLDRQRARWDRRHLAPVVPPASLRVSSRAA